MDRAGIIAFVRAQKWAVQASVTRAGRPQAAVIGVAITDDLELVFDTLSDTRKAENLRVNARVAFVIGWDDGQTVQYEGIVDEPTGDDLARLKAAYFARFPDGVERESWPGITYFRARPTWIRYSDFRGESPRVVEVDLG
ncbi:MAG TPA: pyridoxamine 5'-phosphate oxidase family protein [Labilithrix sp.]|jgi:pyridoxine/pyridoxamine 5'-phosphate oxidase|nr:pyridoxamine 5'-phosphate oxidase family protein [Labilithrix sp.]